MGHSGRGSVLVVDDSALKRTLLTQRLADEGWTCFESLSGTGVARRVERLRPDVVVAQADLLHGGAYRIIDELSASDASVPVILVSAECAPRDALAAIRAGAFDQVAIDDATLDPLLAALERSLRHIDVLRENRRLTCELQEANRALGRQLQELEHQNRRRRLVEDALTIARDHAMSASQAKSAFLTNMSHELRTPLNAMLGYAELMSETVDDARIVSDLGRIVFAGHHLLSLIDDVLDLAKVEAGTARVMLADVEVDLIIEAVRLQATPAILQRGLVFEIDRGTKPLGEIRVDQRLVLQCLHQLVDNAIKFTEEGKVGLRARRQGDRLLFEVSDTGCGIAPREQAVIFHAFNHGERAPSTSRTGPGLGLTIARRLCDIMGGALSLNSEVGAGSTFTVVLPVVGRDFVAEEGEESSEFADWPGLPVPR
ncbi:MAG: ATP-binding protein [Myxococcota bacterium]